MTRTIIRNSGVTILEWGHLDTSEIERAYELALLQSQGKLPPTYWEGAERHAAWLSEVTRAIQDGEIALGLYHGDAAGGSPVAAPPFQVLIARRKGQVDNNFVIMSEPYDSQEPEGTASMLQAARDIALANNAKLLRLHYVPAVYEFVEV